MAAAREIVELATIVLSLPYIFDELDMMIGITWTVALGVLSDELQRLELGYAHPSPYRHSSSSSSFGSQPGTPANSGSFQEQQQPSPELDTISSLRKQKEILLHALDRLRTNGTGQLIGTGACTSPPLVSSFSLPPPSPFPQRQTGPIRERSSSSLSSSSRYSPYRRTESTSSFTTATTARSTPLLDQHYQLGAVTCSSAPSTASSSTPRFPLMSDFAADYLDPFHPSSSTHRFVQCLDEENKLGYGPAYAYADVFHEEPRDYAYSDVNTLLDTRHIS
jgi:hypothetical protein